MMGFAGEMLATVEPVAGMVEGEQEPQPGPSVFATFVPHDGGASAVTLPPEGGTMVVDLVPARDGDGVGPAGSIVGFEGRLAVDVPIVVTVRSADWTESVDILCAGEPQPPAPCELASRYGFTLIDWYVAYADGRIEPGTNRPELDDPGVISLLTDAVDLSAIARPGADHHGGV